MAVNLELMVRSLEKRVAYLERTLSDTKAALKNQTEGRTGKVAELVKAFAALTPKVTYIDKVLDKAFEALTSKVDSIDKKVNAIDKEVIAIDKEVITIDKHLKQFIKQSGQDINDIESIINALPDESEPSRVGKKGRLRRKPVGKAKKW